MGKTLNFEQNSGKFQSAHGLRSRKIRIISPNGLSDAGGVERVMLYAYRALSEHGFRVDIIDQKALSGSNIGRFFSFFKTGPLDFLAQSFGSVSYTHLRAHETVLDLVCRLLLEKKKLKQKIKVLQKYKWLKMLKQP